MDDFALDSLLSPRSVTVVAADGAGAVDTSLPVDTSVPVVTVSPATIVDTAPSVGSEPADLAVVATADRIGETVTALVSAGVDTILVTAAVESRVWFDLLETATGTATDLLGPVASIALPETGFRAGLDEDIDSGTVALLGEDAQTVASLVAEGVHRNLGFSVVLSTGEHGTLGPADVLPPLDAEPDTNVVLTRPEHIDRGFFEAAAGLSQATALAVHAPKWACTEESVAAGAAGAVTPARLRDSVLEQAGVLSVDSVDRLLDLAPALAEQPLPDGDDVVIVSNAGGPGVMATDAVGASRLTMADLEGATVERLEAVIPERAYARNPLDLLADSDVEVFSDVLDAVLTDPGVDAAVVISAPNPLFTFEEMADIVAEARSKHESPVVTALMGGESTADAADRLRRVGIPNYFDPFQAVAVISALADQRDAAAKRAGQPTAGVALPTAKVADVLRTEGDALAVLDAAGVPVEETAEGISVSVVATRVPGLGPVVAVGVTEYAAVLEDVAVRVAPPSEREVRAMIDDLRASQLLKGARGTEAVDVDALVDVIRRVAAIPDALENVQTVEATVAATESGVAVTDGHLTVAHQ